ncbi:hypothetical protein E4U55_007854 [Claviceps digitariae]|nr:hypothetical protein E4U55_007854 [Claviceps digitariae]
MSQSDDSLGDKTLNDCRKTSPSPAAKVCDLSGMSHAQLIEWMKKHWKSGPDIHFEVDGWLQLSAEEKHRFQERMKFVLAYCATLEDPSVNPCPLDFDKLNSLLLDVARKQDSFPQDGTCTSERDTFSTRVRPVYWQDLQTYNDLVNDGGRPLCSIDLLESVLRDPYRYDEMLKPYTGQRESFDASDLDDFDHYDAIPRQWHRWKNFRKWQLDNRGIDDKVQFEEDTFRAIVEELKRDCLDLGKTTEFVVDPVKVKKPGGEWHLIQRNRSWQRQHQRELGCEDFSDYEKALTARLARHGFTQPFRLEKDPKQQDQLTTWIEYLGFEYWWLDRYVASAASAEQKYYKAWEEQRKLGLFKDDDTPELIRTKIWRAPLEAEEARTIEAFEKVFFEVEKLDEDLRKDYNRGSSSEKQRIKVAEEARKRMSAAQEVKDVFLKRWDRINKFFSQTEYYDTAKETVVYQKNLVQWAVKQVQAIENEQKSPAALLETPLQGTEEASVQDVCQVQPTPKRQKSDAIEYSPQPSIERIGLRDIGASTDVVVGELDRHRVRGEHDTHLSKNTAQAQVPEVENDFGIGRGSMGKKRAATPEMEHSVQPRSKRQKPNCRGDGLQGSDSKPRASNTRASRQRVRATANTNQVDGHEAQRVNDTDPSSQSPAPDMQSQNTASRGLRRSSRLASRVPKAEVPSRRNKSTGGRGVSPALGSEYVPVEKLLDKRIRKRGRGRLIEYLVKFKTGDHGSCPVWMASQSLPKNARDSFEQFMSERP